MTIEEAVRLGMLLDTKQKHFRKIPITYGMFIEACELMAFYIAEHKSFVINGCTGWNLEYVPLKKTFSQEWTITTEKE